MGSEKNCKDALQYISFPFNASGRKESIVNHLVMLLDKMGMVTVEYRTIRTSGLAVHFYLVSILVPVC